MDLPNARLGQPLAHVAAASYVAVVFPAGSMLLVPAPAAVVPALTWPGVERLQQFGVEPWRPGQCRARAGCACRPCGRTGAALTARCRALRATGNRCLRPRVALLVDLAQQPRSRLLRLAGRVRPGRDDLDEVVPALRQSVEPGVHAEHDAPLGRVSDAAPLPPARARRWRHDAYAAPLVSHLVAHGDQLDGSILRMCWWGGRDSNPRPRDYWQLCRMEADAEVSQPVEVTQGQVRSGRLLYFAAVLAGVRSPHPCGRGAPTRCRSTRSGTGQAEGCCL